MKCPECEYDGIGTDTETVTGPEYLAFKHFCGACLCIYEERYKLVEVTILQKGH